MGAQVSHVRWYYRKKVVVVRLFALSWKKWPKMSGSFEADVYLTLDVGKWPKNVGYSPPLKPPDVLGYYFQDKENSLTTTTFFL